MFIIVLLISRIVNLTFYEKSYSLLTHFTLSFVHHFKSLDFELYLRTSTDDGRDRNGDF